MGTLHYNGQRFDFEDRLLAHLQLVISSKLRRKECFFLTWTPGVETGQGRQSVWIDNGIAIWASYSGSRAPQINREWAETLAHSSHSTYGLVVTAEQVQSDSAT